jgi:hypothetical protein
MKSADHSRRGGEAARTHVVEKLTHALHILATGKGDARQRVRHAYLACLTLTEGNFPPELAKDWQSIAKALGPAIEGKGTVVGGTETANRNRRMNSTAAARIAHRMWRLYWAVSANEEYK